MHVAEVSTADGVEPARGQSPRSREFQRGIPDRMVEGPVVADATVVGSYGFGFAAEMA